MLSPDRNGKGVNLDPKDYHGRASEALATIIDWAKGPSAELQARFQRPLSLKSPPHQRDSEYHLECYGVVANHMVFANATKCFGIC